MSLQEAPKDSLPTTNYTVASWRQDVLKQSTVGMMTVNKYSEGRWHTTTGANAQYSSTDFLNDKNLQWRGAYVQTYNSNEGFNPQAAAYRMSLQYPNDKVFAMVSHQNSPADFDPEVGLMRRRNFKEWFGMVQLKPRPKKFLTWVRQFTFSPGIVTYDYFHDTKDLQSFSYALQPLGIETRSGENFSFNIVRSGEGVKERFPLTKEITISPGEYWQTRYSFSASSFKSRDISGNVNVEWGGFFEGRSIESNYGIQWRTSKYLTVGLAYEKNWVDLPQAEFQTDLISSRLQYALTPNLFGKLFTQWNNQDQEIITNFRLHWIPVLGADFYFIVNQRFDTQSSSLEVEKTTLIGKLIWRFAL